MKSRKTKNLMSNPLKKYRILRSLTQEELANSSGVSIRTIQRIEKGLSGGSPYTIRTLAKCLNIESSDLLLQEDLSNSKFGYEFEKVKLLNLSIMSLLLIPFGNLIVPTLVFLYNRTDRKVNTLGRKILSFQILHSLLLFFLLFVLFISIGRGNGQIPLPVAIVYITNVFINSIVVIVTSIQINQKKEFFRFVPNII